MSAMIVPYITKLTTFGHGCPLANNNNKQASKQACMHRQSNTKLSSQKELKSPDLFKLDVQSHWPPN
ncbi:hypothetical protein DERP_004897 [Dermatophagoides pteronyssinus]|uniref:Uncharacterized protein n=1 Tax=Dermatophagoides pteronyssinus TaxID=6956 RepID=A0ABQ8JTD6_DERPT|nr:hypothetical protein DERP_004897 [Dermatophagoides pteronyssinus]